MTAENSVIIRDISGLQDYTHCWQAMRHFTDQRTDDTLDEIWLLEHSPVFTQGQNGKAEHIIDPGTIPIVQSDRGGQVTYHGPGQLVVYAMVNLKRKKWNIRQLVTALEQPIIQWLADLTITAEAKCEAPGIYVNNKKIGSVGLRVRRGCSYHGLALNINMDLQPFLRINPCGFAALAMTQFADISPLKDIKTAKIQLVDYLLRNLGYTSPLYNPIIY